MFLAFKNGIIYVYEIQGLMRSSKDFRHITVYDIKNEVYDCEEGYIHAPSLETEGTVRGR